MALPFHVLLAQPSASVPDSIADPAPNLVTLIIMLNCKGCGAGYSLNALVDFPTDDPIEIIKRLMIGSEGTFGFVSRATYNCVPEWPDKVLAALLRWLQ